MFPEYPREKLDLYMFSCKSTTLFDMYLYYSSNSRSHQHVLDLLDPSESEKEISDSAEMIHVQSNALQEDIFIVFNTTYSYLIDIESDRVCHGYSNKTTVVRDHRLLRTAPDPCESIPLTVYPII